MTEGSLPADVVEVVKVGIPPGGPVLESGATVSLVEVKEGVMVPSGIRGVKLVAVEGVPDGAGTVVVGVEYVSTGSLDSTGAEDVVEVEVQGHVVVVMVSQAVTVKVAV